MARIILGCDPGIRHFGVAVLDVAGPCPRLLMAETVGTALQQPPPFLVEFFRRALGTIMDTYRVEAVGAEELTWFSKRQAAGRRQAEAPNELWVKLGVAHAVLMCLAAERRIPYRPVGTRAIKAAAGRDADPADVIAGLPTKRWKGPVLTMARRLFPDWRSACPEPDHEADAMAAGLLAWAPQFLIGAAGARVAVQ